MSEPIDNGGNAFPEHYYFDASRGAYGMHITATDVGCGGMTLRDYFAAKALLGFLANPTTSASKPELLKTMFVTCYQVADAMIAARNEKQ